MAGKPRFTVRRVAGALRRTAGIKTAAAELLGCDRSTITRYINRYPKLQALEMEIADRTVDLAEDKLLKAIEQGNMTAIIFYLKTKGKHRGYTQKQEPGGARNADNYFDRDVKVNINLVPTGHKERQNLVETNGWDGNRQSARLRDPVSEAGAQGARPRQRRGEATPL